MVRLPLAAANATTTESCIQDMAQALFHGCGFVPDLLSLQAWLECAWKGGFDTAGGDMLGNAAQHSDQWIGTTECAALLRFFGLKAQIIDFTGRGLRAPGQACMHLLLAVLVACDGVCSRP